MTTRRSRPRRQLKNSYKVVDLLVPIVLGALTPLLEKNVLKTLPLKAGSSRVPVVFSMSRVIVLAFAIAMFRHIWRVGVPGWPDATLAITIVLALPLLGALERVRPTAMAEIAKTLIARLGVGSTNDHPEAGL